MKDQGRPRIVVAEPLAPAAIERLRQVGDVTELADASPENLRAAVADADVLVVRNRTHVTAKVINAANCLRVIARAGPSVDHIDIRAAHRRNIPVVYTPAAQVGSIAEFTVGLILAAVRRLLWFDKQVRQGKFEGLREHHGHDLRRLTVGILGGGPVADEVARILHAGLGSRLIAHAPQGVEPVHQTALAVSFDTLLHESDVLTLHLASGAERYANLIDAAALAKMKRTAFIVNTSKGNAIDLAALAEALKTLHLAGAALDVFDAEPLPIEHPIRNAPHCILTPHVAAQTADVVDAYHDVVADVIRVLNGQPPLFPVPPKVDPSTA